MIESWLGALRKTLWPPSRTAARGEREALALNVKAAGYDLARALADGLPVREGLSARRIGLGCKPSTQTDMESEWVAYWLGRLTALGHTVAPLGARPLDRFIDVPPYEPDWSPPLRTHLGGGGRLKVTIQGFAATCFGLIVVRGR